MKFLLSRSSSSSRRRPLTTAAGLLLTTFAPVAVLADPAAEEAADLGTVVISANRMPTDQAKVGSSVTVIGRDELERSKETYVKDVLDRVAGVSFSQNGPPGTAATIEMRGAYGRYVLVRVDGIDVSDPSGYTPSAALEHLLVGDVERIEILRGSQSALYGGTAVGGVVDITTKKAETGGIHHSATVEAGSYGTVLGTYGLSAATDTSEFNLSIARLHSDGFSAADEHMGNKERDGYENTTVSANAAHRISDVLRVFGAFRWSRHDIQTDDWNYAGYAADEAPGAPREHTVGEDWGARIGADLDTFGGRLKNTVAVQYFQAHRDGYGSYPWWYEGKRTKIEYLGQLKVIDGVGLSFGADHAHESADGSGLDGSIDNTGVFGQLSWEPLKGVTLTAALRDDHHSMFGDHPTHRLTAAWKVFEDTKLRASWGTGFRPPSVAELYTPIYGNPDLKPETSTSADVGVDQSFWNGRATVSATLFSLDTTDLIGYDASYKSIQISGVSHRKGVELSGRVQALDWLAFDATYTYTDATKPDGTRLGQIPRYRTRLGATVKPMDKTSLDVAATFVGDSIDTATSRKLDSYVLLDATVRYQINEHLEAYLKGRNLLDQRYETFYSYGTPGASVYAGLTAKF